MSEDGVEGALIVPGTLGPLESAEVVGTADGGIGVAGSSNLISEHQVADGEWVGVGLAGVEAVGWVVAP